jgi:diguanylate cyclase (GGDEF)-like protein
MNDLVHDELTGLKNRKSLQKCFNEYSGANSRFGLILIDVDGLIYFNDFYGHVEADEKLKQIADLLCQNVPNGVDVFRSGGDEFAILIKDLNMAEVVALAMQICKAINQTFAHMPPLRRFYGMRDRSRLEVHYPLTASCGVAFYPDDGTTYEDLHRAIDEALFRAGKTLLSGVVALVRNSESE